MRRVLVINAFAILTLGARLFSQQPLSIAGTWNVTIKGGSRVISATLTLEQDGTTLRGIWTRESLPEQRVSGTIRGSVVEFSFTEIAENGKTFKLEFNGSVTAGRMEGNLVFRWEESGAQLGKTRTWSAQPTQSATETRRADAAPLVARFQAVLDRLQNEHGFPGAIAAFILPDGHYRGFATGYADNEAKIRMPKDGKLLAGSIGKTFVAAVALSLAQEGKLELDGKIKVWLGQEDWFSHLPNAKEITLRMLLTHSSGLIDHAQDARFIAAIHDKLDSPETNPDFYFTPRELIAFAMDKRPLFQPGQGYHYSDTGYILAGLIIEKASGSSYYEALQKRFLDPLKLELTVPANRRDIPGLVPGYLHPQNPMRLPEKTVVDGIMAFNPLTEWTGGGLASNPVDLVRWAKALYEGKALAKPYLEDLLLSVAKKNNDEAQYGLGVSIDESAFGRIYGHHGWFPGYRSRLAYFAEHKFAIALQINADFNLDMDAYVSALAKVVVDDLKNK